MLLTHEQDILCVEITDRGYILANCFPKENSYIVLDNLTYESSFKLNTVSKAVECSMVPKNSFSKGI